MRRRIELTKYNDFTIEEFFRHQGMKVGDHCRIPIRTMPTEPFLVSIGNHCTITEGVIPLTHDGGTWIFTAEMPGLQRFGRIDIGDLPSSSKSGCRSIKRR